MPWMRKIRKRSQNEIPKLRERFWVVFSQFIRNRDRDKPCISCGIRGVTDAGHYWPTSQCPQPAMRFNEKNVNGQCVYCNRFQEGARQGYAKGLVQKYGKSILEELDVVRSIKQTPWRRFEYEVMIKKYRALVKIQEMGMGEIIPEIALKTPTNNARKTP